MSQSSRWAQAKHLVVQEGASYGQAAEAAGLSLSTLQKRAATEGWQAQREAALSYADKVQRLKNRALDELLSDTALDSQKLFAWQKVEQVFPEHRYKKADEEDPRLRIRTGLELLEELVAYLGEVDTVALDKLTPHLAPFAARLEKRYAA